MCLYIVTLLFIVTLTGITYGKLHLTPGSPQAERNMHESYAVACHGANTSWIGPENKIISADKGRVHVERKEPGPFLSLVFESLERNDKGKYTCVAMSNGSKEEISFKLIVVKPISFIGEIAVQNVTEFRSDTVRCEVNGDPSPSIVWQYKGKELPRFGGRYKINPRGLYINNITKEDAGIYLCRAFQVTQQTSTVQDQLIELHVHRKPSWKNPLVHGDMENGKVFGVKGGIANITCEVDAEPDANFLWTRKNQTIDPSLNIITDPNKSVLQVPMKNSSVLGSYECKAWNDIGQMWKQFELNEGSKPPLPSSIYVETVGATTAILHIVRGSYDTLGYRVQFVKRYPEYNFSHPDYQDVFTSKPPFTLVNLTEDTHYMFRVAARNKAGLSGYSDEYSFKTRIRSTSSATTVYINMSTITLFLPILSPKLRLLLQLL